MADSIKKTQTSPKKKPAKKPELKDKAPAKAKKEKKPVPVSAPEVKATPKQDKLFENLLRSTRQYISGKNFQPSTFKELREKLAIPKQHFDLFREILKSLVAEGVALVEKQRYHCKKVRDDVVSGVLSVHPRGFAFLQPEKHFGMEQDIFIPKHLTLDAVHGDTVEVLINRLAISEKGPEGRIVTILQRGRSHLAGIVNRIDHEHKAWVFAPLLGPTRPVYVEDEEGNSLTVGDRVILAVKKWGEKETPTICTLKEKMGHITDPSCDIPAAIEEFEIRDHFPIQAIEEAQKFGKQVSASDIAGRADFREVETFTIDPTTAKDFDDALSLSKNKKGHYQLMVHIADVSHYVEPGTALDLEANQRCNSTYFPGRCVPMLPSVLSDNLCSLRANVNRLTVTVVIELDKVGNVVKYEIVKSVIRSAKRFSYEEAKEVLDGKKRSKHAPTLHLMVELCKLLKKQRYVRGSIEFSLSELMVVVDENGMPTGTKRIEYDVTHQLVEEFMLKANEIVAIHLHKQGKEVAYRVHDQPAAENIREFVQICHAFGLKIANEPEPSDFQKMFDSISDNPISEYLANAYIRKMRLAVYSEENIGHYGLSLQHYCHFTSPIRRYIDLVIHRSIFQAGYTSEELSKITTQCSEQERKSSRAEQSVVLLKKLRWLDSIKKEDPFKEYDAVITKIKNFGIYFEAMDVMVEGFLHISNIGQDYYIYDEHKMQLRGQRNGEIYRVGDKLSVLLLEVNYVMLETRWDIIRDREITHQERVRQLMKESNFPKKSHNNRKDERRRGKKGHKKGFR
ncbi:MAG: ribonuclease R [Parachlamydiales bacterium]|jgi:ribonuclease R